MLHIKNAEMYATSTFLSYLGGHIARAGSEAEQQVEVLKTGNSGGRPPRNARDTQVLLCTLGGIIIGIGIGVVIGISTIGTGGIVMGSIGGFVVGGILGSFVGEYLKRRKYRKLEDLAKKIDSHNGQGPIMN